ncbi:carboxypeptidase-like regulatory domain-containing protein [Jeongeupia wiesaeckerbachi]|uniref:carboxypeptidase-like regulatory domain-containing protein n=1 Tax=Jeongeupia wiesaeckerbachi TaxID=3051218 RepID=UPI003D802F15
MTRVQCTFAIGLLTALLAAPAWTELLPVQTHGNVSYVSGGVGDEEMTALKSMQKSYNLHLLFVDRDGHYLSGTQVAVKNARGETVLDARSNGPYFYANLPTGRYSVSASNDGRTQTRLLQVGTKGGKQTTFRW